ncbi:MAG: YfhO family protein [Lachnospiraceae bacterium]|nr:YfhO family protein [Lachnospiraceae bacterium]
MSRIKDWLVKNKILMTGVIIVLLIHLIVMIVNQFSPFGDYIYARGDNQAQLSAYIEELKRKIMTGESWFYTYGALGGADFYRILSYSIFNINMLPLIFVPKEMFVCAINVGLVIQSVLMYFSLNYYMANREFGPKISSNSYEAVAFSLIYAFCPTVLNLCVYYPYIMCCVILPMVILGLERFVANKDWRLYFISLMLMVLSNFYLGLMACLFIVLYYFTLDFESFSHFVKKSIKILGLSCVAVAVSSYAILPYVYDLSVDRNGISSIVEGVFFTDFVNVISSVCWGINPVLSGTETNGYWQSNLFTSMFVLVLCIYYFIGTNIKRYTKLKKLILVTILLASLNMPALNCFFHLFHYPRGMYNRHTIFLLFLIITIAQEGFVDIKNRLSKKSSIKLLVSSGVVLLVMIGVMLIGSADGIKINAFISCVLIVIYFGILLLKKVLVRKNIWTLVILTICVVELSSNYYKMFELKAVDITSNDAFSEIEDSIEELDIEGLEYISYNNYLVSDNIGLMIGYKSYEGYCSGFAGYLSSLAQLGVCSNGSSAVYSKGYNMFLNSILGRKYIINPKKMNSDDVYVADTNDSVTSQYEVVKSYATMDLYSNKECLTPILVSASNLDEYRIVADKRSSDGYSIECKDIVDSTNSLCEGLCGVPDIMCSPSCDFEIVQTSNCNAYIESNKYIVVTAASDSNGVSYNSDNKSIILLKTKAVMDGQYNSCISTDFCLGNYKKGDDIYIPIELKPSSFSEDGRFVKTIDLTTIDESKWSNAYQRLYNRQITIDECKDGYIKGSLNADKDSLVYCAIPYSPYWRITVDGEVVDTENVSEAFLAFHVTNGNHEIELEYEPVMVTESFIISLIAVLIGVVMMLEERLRRKKLSS